MGRIDVIPLSPRAGQALEGHSVPSASQVEGAWLVITLHRGIQAKDLCPSVHGLSC